MAALCVTTLAGGCTVSDGPAEGSGPLRLTQGHLTMMLAPLGEPSYVTVPACGVDGAFDAEIVAVDPVDLRGVEEVEFLAAWLTPGDRLQIGAGRISDLEEPFAPAVGSAGRVSACGQVPNLLELAVVLPDATQTAAVVDKFAVTYRVGDQEYEVIADVTYGVCASDPDTVAAEPPECRR